MITTAYVGQMRNVGQLSRQLIRAAQMLIASLTYDQLAGSIGTIISNDLVRIDRQNSPAGGINLQVQINGIKGASTIATALVENVYLYLTNPGNAEEVQRNVRSALVASLDSLCENAGGIFCLVGKPSNSP